MRQTGLRQAAIALTAALIAVSAVAALAHRNARPGREAPVVWTETVWQRPLDNWGQGRSWRGTSPDGTELLLFARTKSGFCNCYNGVANDDEIDRIGDVDLHGADFTPFAPGVVTAIGDLAGRKRMFRTTGLLTRGWYVLSLVAATDCKAVVATIVAKEPIPPAAEDSARALLTGAAFRQWAANQP